ncbi:MAG: DNA polymerase III subunit delta [Clostridiales bacterium]|nr:DNA polymerase III subunit delta [Clostridiales bacterium]
MHQLKKSISLGLFSPLYLFYGEEDYLLEEMVRELSRAMLPEQNGWNLAIFDGDEAAVGDLLAAARTPVFGGGRRLIIVKNAPWFAAGGKKKAGEDSEGLEVLAAFCQKPPGDLSIIFTVAGSVDKRRKLVKIIEKQGRAVYFPHLRQEELLAWLNQRFRTGGKKAERAALEYLVFAAGNSLHTLALEADKLCLYSQGQQISLDDAQTLVSKGSQVVVFELLEAVTARNALKSQSLLDQLLLQGEAQQRILILLAREFHNLLLAQDMLSRGESPGDLAAALGLPPFVVRKISAAARSFRRRDLITILELMLAADAAQKTGSGKLSEQLPLLILRICAMAAAPQGGRE